MATGFIGKGTPLYLSVSGSPRETQWAGMRDPTEVIPSGRSSIGIAVNAGTQTDINVVYGVAPAGTAFNVMYDVVPTFASEIVLQAVTATSDLVYLFTTNIRASGFIRITNAGGQDITGAWLQQTVANYG